MQTSYREGDLIEVVRHGVSTLCPSTQVTQSTLRECPVDELTQVYPAGGYKNIFTNLEGKAGLIVYVERNRLDQPTGYRVLIEGHEMFCKAVVAIKYFKLMRTQGDESR